MPRKSKRNHAVVPDWLGYYSSTQGADWGVLGHSGKKQVSTRRTSPRIMRIPLYAYAHHIYVHALSDMAASCQAHKKEIGGQLKTARRNDRLYSVNS